MSFSHEGSALATAARDGVVRVWRRPKRKGRNVAPWQESLVLSCPPDEEAVQQARLKR